MIKSRTGKPSPNRGKKIHTEEHKEMMRNFMRGNKFSQGKTPWNKGKGIYPNGRDPKKIRIREERYKVEGRKALYLRNTRAKRKLAVGKMTSQEWTELREKFNHRCPACKRAEPEIKLSIDHIVPLSKGGTNDVSNIQPLCYECNVKKHTKTIKYVPAV